MPPRVIPVMDVQAGEVVRAVGGRRAEYRPNRSPLIASSRIDDVANALMSAARTSEIYVADLDAILGAGRPTFAVADWIAAQPRERRVLLDCGIRDAFWAASFDVTPNIRPVIALETCPGPDLVRQLCRRNTWIDYAFSVDLRGGMLIGHWQNWSIRGPADVLGMATRAVELGIGTLILLDLERVGMGSGTGTDAICSQLRRQFPHVTLITGGGVNTWDDVALLGEAGVDAVLVASALHDGSLTFPPPAP